MTQITSFNEYIPLATRTESLFESVKANPVVFSQLLNAGIAIGNLLDMIKKNVAYGKVIDEHKWNTFLVEASNAIIELNETPIKDLEDKKELPLNPRLFHGAIGIATEATELLEAMDIALRSDNEWDGVNVKEEIADIAWYEAILLDEIGANFYDLLSTNIEKLQARYPEKFSADNAINRNLDVERKILEA